MTDYGEIRRALRRLNDRFDVFDGRRCLAPGCGGAVRRVEGRVVCDRCGPARGSPGRG